MYNSACVEVRGQLAMVTSLTHHVGFKDQTQVVRLGYKCHFTRLLNLASNLQQPSSFLLSVEIIGTTTVSDKGNVSISNFGLVFIGLNRYAIADRKILFCFHLKSLSIHLFLAHSDGFHKDIFIQMHHLL